MDNGKVLLHSYNFIHRVIKAMLLT